MTRRGTVRRLPGGWFAVAGRRDWMRAALAQAALLWVMPWPMTAAGRWAPAGLRHAIERAWARATARAIGMRLEVRGVGHVDLTRRYLVLPLHEGMADALALLHLPVPLRFVARDELAGWPILGTYLRATGQLLVGDRPAATRDLVRAAQAAVCRGESLVVFPQGSVLGIEVAFRAGALRLARRLGLPVLPVVITGSHRVWEHPFGPTLRLGQRVTVSILDPVEVSALSRTELDALTLTLEHRMKALALSAAHGSPRRYVPERDGLWDAYDFLIDPNFVELASRLPHRVRRRIDSERADAGVGHSTRRLSA